jgi:uncharacterized membrane protein
MALFSFNKPRNFFSQHEKDSILDAIRKAETQTSGEARVYIERKCRYVDSLDRAAEVFFALKMEQTQDRNGVLVYVALKDKQFAIFADKGIHEKVGEAFWQREVDGMKKFFVQEKPAQAIVHAIGNIGEALKTNFPYDKETDKNELPDDIVFGR